MEDIGKFAGKQKMRIDGDYASVDFYREGDVLVISTEKEDIYKVTLNSMEALKLSDYIKDLFTK